MPEAKIGFFTDAGGGYYLSRLNDHLGMYFALTSATASGKDLVRIGVATHYVPTDRLVPLE